MSHPQFQLFVAGETPTSAKSVAVLTALCRDLFVDRFDLEVVDVLEAPGRADLARVVAIPTVIKLAPTPQRRAIGDLSSRDRLVAALELISYTSNDPRNLQP